MKIVLIGDSIRMGYLPFVAKKMANVEVWGPAENCRHSIWALDHFQEWVADQKPDIVHVNFGIHDAVTGAFGDGEHQILLEQYRLALKRFIARVKALDGVKMIWATTTPLYAAEQDKPMHQWQILKDATIDEYNAAALEIVESEAIAVNDLYGVVMRNGFDKCLREDGCHMTEFGNEVLSDAVVDAVERLM